MTPEYTDAQLEAGIANALRAGNIEAVRDMLLVLSSQNPGRAADVFDTLKLGLKIRDSIGGEQP